MQLGPTLKKIRTKRSYTLNDVAERIGLTPSFISQIENGKVQPSLQTLNLMLSCYSVTLSDFFKQVEQRMYIFVKKENMEVFSQGDHKFSLKLLASKLQNNTLESYMVDLEHGGTIETAQLPDVPAGERIIYLLSGSIVATIDGSESFSMSEGDSLNFKCQMRCTINNTSGDGARFLIAGVPPVL
jgi:transcriptional regulator with XRE-family HTH domain